MLPCLGLKSMGVVQIALGAKRLVGAGGFVREWVMARSGGGMHENDIRHR